MAETKRQKALRYLSEGRLEVTSVNPAARAAVIATCRGSDQTYSLGYDRKDGKWRCTCEASAKFYRECTHLVALKLVVTAPAC